MHEPLGSVPVALNGAASLAIKEVATGALGFRAVRVLDSDAHRAVRAS
jgi:hypothetical protein